MAFEALKHPKATTFRLDPQLQEGLTLLSQILKRPQNRLVNEAVEDFLQRRSAEVEIDLERILGRVRAYRNKDSNFDAAIAAFVDAEASLGAEDPAEGRTRPNAGPAQTLVRELLRD
jgi:predicted DNA-binding protein